jgi:hypothetical protein
MASKAKKETPNPDRKHPHVPTPEEMQARAVGPRVRVSKGCIGYYGLRRRRSGSVFTLESEKHFSPSWMERVDSNVPETAKEQDAPQAALYKAGGAPPQLANVQVI